MIRHTLIIVLLCALILLTAPSAARAAEVFDNVPADAFGFVIIKNLGATNAKAEKLLQTLQLQFPGPLAFLDLATGVGEGLDPRGDMLLAILPGKQPTDRPQLGIWLPVSDYNHLVTALDGTPDDEITAVRIAGEDLLIAHHGQWALIMDPDQRERLLATLSAQPKPPAQIADWREWIQANDISTLILPSGLRAAWAWAATDRPEDIAALPPPDPGDDDLFGPPVAGDNPFGPPQGAVATAGDLWSELRRRIRTELEAFPQLARWVAEGDAVACGVRIDADGNAVAGVRLAWQNDWPLSASVANADNANADPPSLLATDEYIISGAGRLPATLAIAAAGAYARLTTESLKNDIQVQMDDKSAAHFREAVERATAEVTAATVLTRPGNQKDGIHSNQFLAARVRTADEFVDRIEDVMRLWNEMNKSEQDESKLVFDVEQVQIGGRDAIQFSLDMVEAFGSAAAVPGMRPSMEQLFGPGGKFRLLVVTTDEHTVLLAAATSEQVAPVLEMLSKAQPISWDERTGRLLPRDASWRLMVSPHGHTRWLKRQMDAMLGPVIGGPIVREFPPSPPIGAAGGFSPHELWTDIAVPAETIRAAAQYLNKR